PDVKAAPCGSRERPDRLASPSAPDTPVDPAPEEVVALPAEYRVPVDDLRSLLKRVASLVDESEDGAAARATAPVLEREIDELFRVVVVGEVKSGKSALLNALLNATVCPEGPTPLTDKIHVLRYGDEPVDALLEEHVLDRRLPIPLLRRIRLVDTPGT